MLIILADAGIACATLIIALLFLSGFDAKWLLFVVLAVRSFGAEPWYLTVNEMVFFIGNILGGILISSWGGFKDKKR